MMSPEAKRKMQLALLLAMVVEGLRAGYILYERHEDKVAAEKQKQAQNLGYSNPDYYVSPKKLYPYDVKSAKQLTQQPVWVKEGYRYTYYRYDPARKQVDFAHEVGLLLPIEKLEIKDVVTAMLPTGKGARRQVVAVFQHEVKPGMNEMQADFAIGMGVPDAGDTSYEKTVRYPNGGKPVVVVYHDGKA